MDAPKMRHHHRTFVLGQFLALLALHAPFCHPPRHSAPLTRAMSGSPKAVLSNQSIRNRLRRFVVQRKRPMVRILFLALLAKAWFYTYLGF